MKGTLHRGPHSEAHSADWEGMNEGNARDMENVLGILVCAIGTVPLF